MTAQRMAAYHCRDCNEDFETREAADQHNLSYHYEHPCPLIEGKRCTCNIQQDWAITRCGANRDR